MTIPNFFYFLFTAGTTPWNCINEFKIIFPTETGVYKTYRSNCFGFLILKN